MCYPPGMLAGLPLNRPLPRSVVLRRALPRAGRTILMLIKLMIPISLGVGLLRWTGALEAIGRLFAPAMGLFHLPGEAAVPLVTGYLGGIYALIGAMTMLPFSAETVTILSAMALVAHNLIIEGAVQHRTGTPWWYSVAVRLVASSIVGLTVAWSISALQAADLPALWLRFPTPEARSAVPASGSLLEFLAGWGREAAKLTVKIVLIVTAMMIATEWIRARGLMERMERGSRPFLRFLGLHDSVAFPWLTAQILGIAFGGGLLLEEMQVRRIDPREVRALHISIGISHSLLEDTVLLMSIGASIFWIIVPRVLVAAAVVRLATPFSVGLPPRSIESPSA